MSHRLDVFATDDVLFELLRRRRIDWQDVLVAGGIDPVEAEHREFVELQCHAGSVIVVTEPV
jgi:hypothetical protein